MADDPKTQPAEIAAPEGVPPGVIISPDTRRPERVPPGQSRTRKWPVLDASGPPSIDLARWRFRLDGLVAKPIQWNWEEFGKLPRIRVFADFHCVTRWSRLGNTWEGVSTRELMSRAGGPLPNARFALVAGYDSGWTTNLPLQALLADGKMDELLQGQDAVSQRVYDRARTILSPDQLNTFGRFQTNQMQMMRVGMSMAKKMFAPEKPTPGAAPTAPVPAERAAFDKRYGKKR